MLAVLRRRKPAKTAFSPKKPDTWSPLLKMLAKWRIGGNTGLTIHALATLTKREPEELLAEIAAEKYIYGQSCGTVGAVVWATRVHVDDDHKPYLALPQQTTGKKTVLEKARAELARWPWPANKGIEEGYPIKKAGVGDYTKPLRALARNEAFAVTAEEQVYW